MKEERLEHKKEKSLKQLRVVFGSILNKFLRAYISESEILDIKNLLLYEVKIRINDK